MIGDPFNVHAGVGINQDQPRTRFRRQLAGTMNNPMAEGIHPVSSINSFQKDFRILGI